MPALRLPVRAPAHLLNGLTVAVGVGLVQAIGGWAGGAAVGLMASGGAIFASLSDTPLAPSRTWRRVVPGALLGCATSVLVTLLRGHPAALGAAIVLLGGLSAMLLAWGARAGPLSFVPILAMVFTLAAPPLHGATVVLEHAGWTLLGGALYVAWAYAVSTLLQPRYRTLALAAALHATANLLRARGALLSADAAHALRTMPLQAWIAQQAALDERLQAARDFLFDAPAAPNAARGIALLLSAIDLRDTLLASELDLDLLGSSPDAARVRAALAQRMASLADALDAMDAALRLGGPMPTAQALPPLAVALGSLNDGDRVTAGRSGAAVDAGREDSTGHLPQPPDSFPVPPPVFADDPHRRRLAAALAARADHMGDDLAGMQAVLRDDGPAPALPLGPRELRLFVSPEGWPLAALRRHTTLASPVLRHALRTGAALGCAYFLARALPWASHPHWLVLSVAVVLRGTLEQTLARRNGRIAGTAIGCLLVLALAQLHTPALATVVFLVAIAVAHAFVMRRYLVAAAAATVMALLQAHLSHPAGGFGIGERLADTLIGAALAWCFSYLLPSWERDSLPTLTGRARRALVGLTRQALRWPDDAQDTALRLARRDAYDAIGAIAAAAQRTGVEPQRVRLSLPALATLLTACHLLLAHLAATRSLLVRRPDELDRAEADAALVAAAAEIERQLVGTDAAASALTAGAGTGAEADADADATGDADTSLAADLPPEHDAQALTPWLHRRLGRAVAAAGRVAHAAVALRDAAARRDG